MNQLSASIALLIAASISGCASVKMGDPGRSAELKRFDSKSNVGQIYICRTSRTFGLAIRPDAELNGKLIGTIARSTFAYQEVSPGEHTLVVKTTEHDSKMPFTVAAGEQKFFQVWISPGILTGWGIVDEIDKQTGKDCVAHGELVEADAEPRTLTQH